MTKFFLITFSLAFTAGCATTGSYTRTGASLVSNFQEAGMATRETNATKRGESCSQNILGIASTGDSSIDSAKKDGGITRVASVDYKVFNILFVYGRLCTVVTGE